MKNSQLRDEHVCVIDFGGSYVAEGFSIYPFNYWADWFPNEKLVRFGGRLADIPDMISEIEPSEAELDTWIKSHGGFRFSAGEKSVLNRTRTGG